VTVPPAAAESPVVPLAEVEKRAVLSAIQRFGGSVSKAAEALGVSKVTVYAKLRSWGMHPRDRLDETGESPTSGRPSSSRLPTLDDPRASPSSKRSPPGL
jgi:transposase